jgi:Zn-dependent M28 family amino/carboxypeptidase
MLARGWFAASSATVVAAVLAGVWLSTGDSEAAPAPPTRAELVAQLPRAVSTAQLRSHLAALQRIADANGGTRVAGGPGYAASVRYVRQVLRGLGYAPQAASFPFVSYRERTERARQVSPVARRIRIEAIDYSPSTPARGLRARVVAAAGDGCAPGHFQSVRGRIALASRGVCFIRQKAQLAAGAGAIALLVFNPETGPIDATLGDPNASTIPVGAIEERVARSLIARKGSVVTIEIRTEKRRTTSQNVVAATHARGQVLMIGAHLDSVVAGPGMNDNATGVAAVLELARVLRANAPALAVRFGFWGAEELGLIGSRAYVSGIDPTPLVGYLNFDMLGSHGGTAGVYEGPFAVPMRDYLRQRGRRPEMVDLTGSSDHFPFAQVGVPTGGLFSGLESCYHAACDRLGRVDFDLLRDLTAAAAVGAASFAPMR